MNSFDISELESWLSNQPTFFAQTHRPQRLNDDDIDVAASLNHAAALEARNSPTQTEGAFALVDKVSIVIHLSFL
jgi:hypothetical protein